MNALFAAGGSVPLARVVADHRRVLLPLAALLAVNIGVLVLLVLQLGLVVTAVVDFHQVLQELQLVELVAVGQVRII